MSSVFDSVAVWRGVSGAVVLVLIVKWVMDHPVQVAAAVAWVARQTLWVSRRGDRIAVSQDILATVNGFVRRAKLAESGAPRSLRIEWQRRAAREAFVRAGQVVIKLDYHENQDRNVALVTHMFLSKSLVPLARPYLASCVGRAVDITATRKALMTYRHIGPLSWFAANELEPAYADEPALEVACRTMDTVDEAGLFLPILLPEFNELGHKLSGAGTVPRQHIADETTMFIAFLRDVAQRRRGEEMDTSFGSTNIHAVIVMVGRPEKVAEGVTPYVDFVRVATGRGMRSFYVVARGRWAIAHARRVASACTRELGLIARAEVLQDWVSPDSQRVSTVCIPLTA